MQLSRQVGSRVALVLALMGMGWWMLQRTNPEDHAAPSNVAPSSADFAFPQKVARHPPALPALSASAASVEGTVRSEAGTLLADAHVCVFVTDTEPSPEPTCTHTGADGRYRIETLRPGRYDVAASAPHHMPGRYREPDSHMSGVRVAPSQQRSGLDIELRLGGVEVFGTVYDIAGGVVPSAVVRSGYVGSRSGASPSVAFSDDDGNVSLWVEPGTVVLHASAEGYGTETRSWPAPGTHLQLFLTPEAVVVGRVVDTATGAPVEGARVSVGRAHHVRSNAEGRFRIGGLTPGVYKPKATVDHGYGEAASSVHLGLGETSASIVVRMHPAASVSGQLLVRTEDMATPCADGAISLSPIPSTNSGGILGKVEAEGRVRIRGVLPGRYQVTASCTGYLAEDSYGELEVSNVSIEGLVWNVGPGLAIRGRLLGDPSIRRSASIRVRSIDTRASTSEIGDRGDFELTGLRPGTYTVEVTGRDVPAPELPIEVTVHPGHDVNDIEIELLPSATLVGRVEDENGNPVAAAKVRAEGLAESWKTQRAADDGTFEIRGLRGGEYRVHASLDGGGSLRKPGTTDDDIQGELVTVEPGANATVTVVVESCDHTIAGVVVDHAGSPVSDAFVRAKRLSDSKAANPDRGVREGRWGGWNRHPNMTDTDGSFMLEGLCQGSYTVRAYRNGGGEGYAQNVSNGATDVSVQLAMTGRIEGTVTTASGNIPGRFRLSVHEETTGFSRSDSFFATDGRFVMDELPPGTFFVTATSKEGSGDTLVTLAAASEQAGVTLTLQKLVSVRGQVVDLETGEPVPGLQIAMGRKKSGSFALGRDGHNITDDNGEYTIDSVPVGPVTVSIVPMQYYAGENADYDFTSREIVVHDADPATVKTLHVVRRRVKNPEQQGDLGFTIAQGAPKLPWTEWKLVIGFVRPGGPAAAAGLKVGATIVSVEGHDVTGPNTPLYPPLVTVPAGTTLQLGLEDGSTIELTTTKKP